MTHAYARSVCIHSHTLITPKAKKALSSSRRRSTAADEVAPRDRACWLSAASRPPASWGKRWKQPLRRLVSWTRLSMVWERVAGLGEERSFLSLFVLSILLYYLIVKDLRLGFRSSCLTCIQHTLIAI
jgi:hypothetical protein